MASIPLLRLSLPLHHRHHQKPNALLLPHPLKPTLLSPPKLRRALPKPTTTITCSYTPTRAGDRLISALAYFVPFLNGLQYGRFLFTKYTILTTPFEPLLPVVALYRSLPYASFIIFFWIYLAIVRNPRLSRYVRFNSLQALVLDVLLVVPVLLQKIFTPGGSAIGLMLTAMTYTGLFIIVVACFVYGLVSSILGKTPYFPFVSEAAGHQLDSDF